ncbi:MAG: 1-deoxy-D-xylulose-5-phosphate reductoisomerase [Chthoniobacterales bacterium]
MKKRIVILGATGSIGVSAQKVARALPDAMQIVGISAHGNSDGLAAAAREFGVSAACLTNPSASPGWSRDLPIGCRALEGAAGLIDLATSRDADMVLIAIVGTAGLKPALAAIRAGKDIAVASKEILVMAGEIVMAEAKKFGVRVLPVDSEHNAIFQCLEGRPTHSVERLILTCSGGPFRQTPTEQLTDVQPDQALCHPTWNMGQKISIDSATLFNKGLEMIEARWLFDLPMDRIDVIVHPQSIVHSMVEFVDGSLLAQLSCSDMAFPIQYAVTWPERVEGSLKRLDLAALRALEFEAPREDAFPALRLAREAGARGGTLPAVLNAANESAVAAFLAGDIRFPQIWFLVESAMLKHVTHNHPTLDELFAADAWARDFVAGEVYGT